MIDLDAFKQINDTFGLPIEDRLLVEIGRRLEAVCRNDTILSLAWAMSRQAAMCQSLCQGSAREN